MVCGLDKSPQQLAYNIYRTLAAVLAKDYAMVQFAYMLLELHGKGDAVFEHEIGLHNVWTQRRSQKSARGGVWYSMGATFSHERGALDVRRNVYATVWTFRLGAVLNGFQAWILSVSFRKCP